MLFRRTWAVVGLVLALIAGACGGGDDDASDPTASPTTAAGGGDSTPATTAASPTTTAGAPATTAPSGGGGVGELVLDAETIVLDRALCYLQEQDAAGGGKILFTAQATGVNAAGSDVLVDWTRFDENTQFAGDDVLINIGPDEFASKTDIGTITVDGSTVRSPELTFTIFKDSGMLEVPGSFEINC